MSYKFHMNLKNCTKISPVQSDLNGDALQLYQLTRQEWGSAATICKNLSPASLHSAASFPEFRPPILTNEPMVDKPMKLLLLPSPEFLDFLDLLGLEWLTSISVTSLITLTATRFAMLQRQKGQLGASGTAVVRSSFLWQYKARVHWSHIWCPHALISIEYTRSKQMQQSSTSPASEGEGDGSEGVVLFKMAFSHSLFLSIKAFSSCAFVSGFRSVMNLNCKGQTRGSADEGFNKAAEAWCLYFNAITYGILLEHPLLLIFSFKSTEEFQGGF